MQALIDKDAIRDLVLRYSRGVDRQDFALLRTLYTPDAVEDNHGGGYTGSAEGYIDWLMTVMPRLGMTTHGVQNHLIAIESDSTAQGEVYMTAYHRLPAEQGGGWVDLIHGMRYLDHYVNGRENGCSPAVRSRSIGSVTARPHGTQAILTTRKHCWARMGRTIHPTPFSSTRSSRGTADRPSGDRSISAYATARVRGLSSLRRELIGAGIAIAVAILAIAIIVLIVLRNQTIDNSDREMSAVSRITAERTAQTFSAADVLIRSIVDLAAKPAPGEPATLRERAKTRSFHDGLVRLQKLLPNIEVTAVIDANGDVLGSSREFPAPNANIASIDFFKTLRERPDRGLLISDPTIQRVNGEWTLYLARSLTDAQGNFPGHRAGRHFGQLFRGLLLGDRSGGDLDPHPGQQPCAGDRPLAARGRSYRAGLAGVRFEG